MAWGIQSWGVGSWGGADFIVTNHFPIDNSTGNNRLSTIAFTLLSQSGNVTLSSINLTANGVPLITAGIFTEHATGSINNTNPLSVNVAATVTHAFAPYAIVTVLITAFNTSGEQPLANTATWLFAVDNTLYLFSSYIVRRFEKVLRVGVIGLDAPQNPSAVVELAPPPNLQAEEI